MFELAIVFVCLLLNAILSASEIAFVSINKKVLRQLSKTFPGKTQRLLRLREQPERTLSVIQLGITLVGLVAGAVGGAGVEESLSPWLRERFGLGPATSELISITMLVLPLTALTVIFGELVPKALAMQRPFEIAAFASRGLALLDKVFHPVISFFEWATKSVVGALGILLGKHREAKTEPAHAASEEQIARHHEQYILNLVNIEAKSVQDIHTPWEEVVSVERSDPIETVLEVAVESGHTRLPVRLGRRVIGLINTKELMAFASQGAQDWVLLLRPVLRVQAQDSLIRVLKMMQEKRSHLAVLSDAEGLPQGIVTLEDILEEVVGDIYDEDDDRAVERLLAQKGALRHRGPGNPPWD